jgi:hypothetical protein
MSKELFLPASVAMNIPRNSKSQTNLQFRGIDAWGPEKFENSGTGFLSLHTSVCTLKNPRCEG